MYEPLRQRTLAILKVPAEPHPPAGDPASLRVFRAGENYLRLRLAGWAVTQVLALAGIIFWTTFLVTVERTLREEAAKLEPVGTPVTPIDAPDSPDVAKAPKQPVAKGKSRPPNRVEQFASRVEAAAKKAESAAAANQDRGKMRSWYAGYRQFAVEIGRVLPERVFVLVWVLKIGGIVFYLVQLPVSYAARRLDFEMRWYLVTDRSLRLRHGVWTVSESTMSFANVQEVVVTQGPLQRLLGLADVQVKSAGGGGGGHTQPGQAAQDDLKTGRFHSVTNAPEVRDLILSRLKSYRDSGLGDPEERNVPVATTRTEAGATPAEKRSEGDDDVLAAAREAIAEARALRAEVS